MEQNVRLDGELSGHWGEVVRAYCELMDDLLPSLAPAEQLVYQRLFRLSHARQSPFAKSRYEDLATHCGISLRTLQRALKGLRHKKLVKTVWQSHGATTFQVQLLSTLPHRPAFLPRRRRGEVPSPPLSHATRPPVYDAFSPEDRDLFLACKRSLSPVRLNELTDQAVEWLTECANGDPEAFSDDILRDTVDELIFREVFGAERRERYEALFAHLYRDEMV
jgi:hypothetical protein